METAVFRCDFCGTKSEEENVAWRRPRCSIELILRGRRFAVAGTHTLYGVPYAGVAGPDGELLPSDEDSRWALSLCDHCMKRISALVGLNLETPEEISHRQEQLARQVASNVEAMASSRGKLVSQFPTPPNPPVVVSEPPGGLIAQYPTERQDVRGNFTGPTQPSESGAYAPPGVTSSKSKSKKRPAKKSKKEGGVTFVPEKIAREERSSHARSGSGKAYARSDRE